MKPSAMRTAVLSAWIAFGAMGANAQQPGEIAIPDIPYTKYVLKNGLTLLVHEDHKLPVVAVNTWYHVGSKNESAGKTGFAHLFEHLMFSGSENFDKVYLSAMSGIGATSLNGTTNPDRTNYFQNVPTSMLDYALFAESDRMGHFLGALDQKKLDLQRGVVQNEKRQGENQPYGVTRQLLAENTYPPGHPYSWTTIGSMKDLEAASMADVQEWFKTHYGPNNVTLVLAGDIAPEVARQKVEKYYGDIPPGPPLAQHRAWIAKRSGTQRDTVQDRVPQARLYRVWNVPGAHTPTSALLDLAAQVLGGGKTSRLYKRLVFQDQLATSATARNSLGEIAGQFELVLTGRPGADTGKMERAADEELRAFMRTGPTEAELQLARTAILARYARLTERVGGFGGKSDLLAGCMTYTGNPACYKDDLQRVKAATPAMVKQAMAEWLSDGDYLLQVEPFAGGSTTSALDRRVLPEPGKPETLRLPPMRKTTLPNGLTVAVVESHSAPVVNMSLIVDSGYASDPEGLPGLSTLTLRMIEEGTARRDALKAAADIEAIGASFSTGASLDSAFVTMNALKATLPAALEIYSDMVLHPAFAQAPFTRVQKDQLAAIQREKSNPQAMAVRVLPAILYGKGHLYAHPPGGTEAAVFRMTQADVAAHHAIWFRPNNATLLVVGDTTLAEVTPFIEKAFSGWKAAPVPPKSLVEARAPAKPVVYLMDRPGSQQSVIYVAQLAPPANSPDAVPLQILNGVFGSSFSSRLNMNLREEKHWSYGVRSDLVPARGERAYVSRAPVQADKTKETLQELAREYRELTAARPVTADELKAAQLRESLSLPGAFETSAQLSDAYSAILQYRLPESYYDDFTAKAMAVTPDAANTLARRLVVPSQLTWVVVGDMAKVEAGIRELKLGEVRRIDADGNLLP